jgi:hypothetical protein
MAGEILNFKITDAVPGPVPLLTVPGGIGLYRQNVVLDLDVTVGGTFSAAIDFEGLSIQLGSNGDSFLEMLLPGGPQSQPFDAGLRWDGVKGITFQGGSALEVTLPLRAALPLIKLQALHVIATPQLGNAARITLELSVDAEGSLLGIIAVTVERIGISSDFYVAGATPPDAIPLGPISARVHFKPPTGAGLTLNLAGIVNGGGFLSIDSDRGRYAGVLSLQLLGLSITAIGIINTKPNLSVLAILTANFGPAGLDIGFGFTINAIGGLFGLNRGMNLDALRDAVRTNAISSLMFPSNPVEDAPRLINDLEQMFPALQDHFLIGPMIQLGWGKPAGMFTLSLGVIIQVPDPKVAIVGIMKVLVPPGLDQAPLRLQVNFIGAIDFGEQFLTFDASLFDSQLILYTLEGDIAARLRWGSNAAFAISAGGFHPRYVVAADMKIAPMKRIAINLIPGGDNPRLRMESYYAVTSNSLQHGAKIELYAEAAGFGIKGFLGYDLLVQISPLHFDAAFGGSIAVLAGGEEIFSLQLDLMLSGPSPWHVDGDVSFKLLFIKIRVGVHATFGSEDSPSLPSVDVAALFRQQFDKPRNWTAVLPPQSQMMVVLVPRVASLDNEVVAHPSASIEFNQNLLPLNLTLQRFGAAKPSTENNFDLLGMSAGGDLVAEAVFGEFPPAQYTELTNDQKMSAPAFQQLRSGIRAKGEALVKFSTPVKRDYGYQDHVVDSAAEEFRFLNLLTTFNVLSSTAASYLGGSALGHSDVYKDRVAALPTGDEIKLTASGYRVVNTATLAIAGDAIASTSHIEAVQALSIMVSASPALAGKLMVVPEHELV